MASRKKKTPIQRYTLLWFLELLFYGFYWNAVVRTRLLAYVDPITWLFWFFPSLKQRHAVWYQRKFGTAFKEDDLKVFNDPVSGFNNWYATWAVFMVLYCVFMGLFNMLCMIVQQDLYRVIHPLVPFVTLFFIASGIVDYLEWNKRHLPYFKEFSKLSRGQKRWLGWGCTLLLLFSVAFFVATLVLSEMYLESL